MWFTYAQGLVDAYVADSQQAKAVSYLTGLRDKILANAAPAAAAAADSSSSNEAAAADAAADAASSSTSAAAEQQLEVDPIGVQLLLGELLRSAVAVWHANRTSHCALLQSSGCSMANAPLVSCP
jgi:hypothetical protein